MVEIFSGRKYCGEVEREIGKYIASNRIFHLLWSLFGKRNARQKNTIECNAFEKCSKFNKVLTARVRKKSETIINMIRIYKK